MKNLNYFKSYKDYFDQLLEKKDTSIYIWYDNDSYNVQKMNICNFWIFKHLVFNEENEQNIAYSYLCAWYYSKILICDIDKNGFKKFHNENLNKIDFNVDIFDNHKH